MLRASNRMPEEGPQELGRRAEAIRQAAGVPGGSQYNEQLARQALETPGPYNRPFEKPPAGPVRPPTVKPLSATPEEWADYLKQTEGVNRLHAAVEVEVPPLSREVWPTKPPAAPSKYSKISKRMTRWPPPEWFPDPAKPLSQQHPIRVALRDLGYSAKDIQGMSDREINNITGQYIFKGEERVGPRFDVEGAARADARERATQAAWDRMREHIDFVDRLRRTAESLDWIHEPLRILSKPKPK
jgi:hypothetical protein